MKIRVLIGACLLAAVSSAAYALGLGEILVKSKLNQPLEAEIVVRESAPGEAEQLTARLATPEDHARVGLERARVPVMLRFDTSKNERGETIIRVRSDEPVREPFLTLLVEANWAGGRLLREYGILLDPPVAAPSSSLTRVAAPPPAPAQTQALAETPPASPEPALETVTEVPPPAEPAPAAQPEPAPVAAAGPAPATPPPASRTTPPPPPGFARPPEQRPAPVASPPAAEAPVAAEPGGTYTVQRGDTLSRIARTYAEAAGVTPNQMMLAIQRENPRAFFNDNINGLRAGAVLRIPDAGTAASVRATEAAAEVRRQNAAWGGVAALADAGSGRSAPRQARPAAPAEDRLELLPPGRPGAGSEQAAGRAGAERGGADVAGIEAELKRTREELRSRDQELAELTSRVRDLEELNAKNSRLLELKNAELAELQRRLAEATAATSATVAPPPAPAEAPAPAAEAPVDQPAEEVDAVETPMVTPAEGGDVEGPAASEEPGEASVTEETGTGDDLFADEEGAGEGTADTWAPAEPAAAAPAPAAPAPAPATVPAQSVQPSTPSPAAEPWYMNPLIQGGILLAIALVLILLLLSRRRRQQAAAVDKTRPSVADFFREANAVAVPGPDVAEEDASAEESEIRVLVEQIEADPGNFGAYLELLSIHYSNGDRDQFEHWARRFHERPGSEITEEWQSVRVMGQELLPGHELFAAPAAPEPSAWAAEEFDAGLPGLDEPAWSPQAPAEEPPPSAPVAAGTGVIDLSPDASLDDPVREEADEEFEPIEFEPLDVGPSAPETSAGAPSWETATQADDTIDFTSGDSLGTGLQDDQELFGGRGSAAPADDAGQAAEEASGGLDDAATKLELARAYLDMGDPEGARAMLEEVLSEGDTSQREAARQMLASL